MTKKTVKVLDDDLKTLKGEFDTLKTLCVELSAKYEYLEKKCQERVPRRSFECMECKEQFDKMDDLKEHRKMHNLSKGPFDCEICGKTFDEEWKLSAHLKTHKVFSCDQCNKTFKYEETKTKHIQIAHGSLKIYCCYYNNDTECLYGDECIFLHEDSAECKYGDKCERKKCMYKHTVCETNKTNDNHDERGECEDDDE